MKNQEKYSKPEIYQLPCNNQEGTEDNTFPYIILLIRWNNYWIRKRNAAYCLTIKIQHDGAVRLPDDSFFSLQLRRRYLQVFAIVKKCSLHILHQLALLPAKDPQLFSATLGECSGLDQAGNQAPWAACALPSRGELEGEKWQRLRQRQFNRESISQATSKVNKAFIHYCP